MREVAIQPETGHPALELREVEVVPPGRDATGCQLEGSHHGELHPLATDLEAIGSLGEHDARLVLRDLVQHPLDPARHAGESLERGSDRCETADRLHGDVVIDAVVGEVAHELVEVVALPGLDEAPDTLEVLAHSISLRSLGPASVGATTAVGS